MIGIKRKKERNKEIKKLWNLMFYIFANDFSVSLDFSVVLYIGGSKGPVMVVTVI